MHPTNLSIPTSNTRDFELVDSSGRTLPGDFEETKRNCLSRNGSRKQADSPSAKNIQLSEHFASSGSSRRRSLTAPSTNYPTKDAVESSSKSSRKQSLLVVDQQDTAPSSPIFFGHRRRSATVTTNYRSKDALASGESMTACSSSRKSSILATKGKTFQFDWLRRSFAGKNSCHSMDFQETEMAIAEDAYGPADLDQSLSTQATKQHSLHQEVSLKLNALPSSRSFSSKSPPIVIDGSLDWLPNAGSRPNASKVSNEALKEESFVEYTNKL
jgi:hypothetical protein